jgi:MerR family transcriptional regulator/heat shock protein HspR
MNGNECEMRSRQTDLPVYTLAEAAELLRVHPQTLRNYRAQGLVRPARINGRWMFSDRDIRWTECLRTMIHEKKLSIPGLRKLLQLLPCWMVASCPVEVHYKCPAQVDWSLPRKPHRPGSGPPAPDRDGSVPGRQAAGTRACCGG